MHFKILYYFYHAGKSSSCSDNFNSLFLRFQVFLIVVCALLVLVSPTSNPMGTTQCIVRLESGTVHVQYSTELIAAFGLWLLPIFSFPHRQHLSFHFFFLRFLASASVSSDVGEPLLFVAERWHQLLQLVAPKPRLRAFLPPARLDAWWANAVDCSAAPLICADAFCCCSSANRRHEVASFVTRSRPSFVPSDDDYPVRCLEYCPIQQRSPH
jgi:hypothetical protein